MCVCVCVLHIITMYLIFPQWESKKEGETTNNHYFVQPVTYFLFGAALAIFVHKLTLIDERNNAVI